MSTQPSNTKDSIPYLEELWKEFIIFSRQKIKPKIIKKKDPITGEIVEKVKNANYNFTNITKDLEEFINSRKSGTTKCESDQAQSIRI